MAKKRRGGGEDEHDALSRVFALLDGYRNGSMRYGLFVSRKPG